MFARVLPVIATTFALATPLHAQEGATMPSGAVPAGEVQTSPAGNMITAEMIEDATIVSLQGQYSEDIWNSGEPLNAMVAGLNEIGEVEDIILSPDGEVLGLSTDVGGFLGIGQKEVMIPLDDIRLTRAPDEENVTVITRMSDRELQDAPEFTVGD